MARPFCIAFRGAPYDVMSRGNERRRIVRDDADRQKEVDRVAPADCQDLWLGGARYGAWTRPGAIEPHRERTSTDAYSLFTA